MRRLIFLFALALAVLSTAEVSLAAATYEGRLGVVVIDSEGNEGDQYFLALVDGSILGLHVADVSVLKGAVPRSRVRAVGTLAANGTDLEVISLQILELPPQPTAGGISAL